MHLRAHLRNWGAAAALAAGLAACAQTGAVVGGAAPASEPPRFVTTNGRHALMVDGAPFLILGVQANNSSNYPSQLPEVWPAVEQVGANTLEIPVAWEQIEPEEGRFDFSYVDTLIRQARAHDVRLVLLWFATWKNTGPSYAPSWVKLDNARFPRIIQEDGTTSYALSPHHPSTLDADRAAFAALMRHLRQVDGGRHTVIMVQVENEPGVYGAVRDYGPEAQAAFESPVPDALADALGVAPEEGRRADWATAFGDDADEFFHAWHTARYIEAVAAAGKAEYDLPMYANAALRDPLHDQDPHTYASGGPTFNVIDIYKAAAPSLAALAPDIYDRPSETVEAHLDAYARPDNPLLIVEIGSRELFARYFFSVLGRGGVGFAPFGMDFTDYANAPLGAPAVDDESIAPFAANFALVTPIAREWARLAYESEVWGAGSPDDGAARTFDLGRWTATIAFDEPIFGFKAWNWLGPSEPTTGMQSIADGAPLGGALIARLGPDEFLVTGRHARVSFDAASLDGATGFMMARVEEVRLVDGDWVVDRVWNGDQTDYGLNFTDRPRLLRVRLATY